MISITYAEIFNMFGQERNGPMTSLRNAKLSVPVALKVRRVVRALEPYYLDVLEEQNKLVEELGEGDPKVIKFDTPQFTEFEQRMKALSTEKVDIDIQPLNALELSGVQLSEFEIQILEPILELEG